MRHARGTSRGAPTRRWPRRASVVPLALLTVACSGDRSGDRSDDKAEPVAVAQVHSSQRPILFTSDRDGSSDVWLAKEDGTDPVQLTTSAGYEGFATWSPDGRQIAFSGSVGEAGADLYVVGSDGNGLRRVVQGGERDASAPVWSPDGSRLMFTATEPDEEFGTLSVIGVDGTGERSLVRGAAWGDWSPDGSRIVYAAEDAQVEGQSWIRVMQTDGSHQQTLSPESLVAANEPSWSPDGRKIAFSASFGHPDADSENMADWDYDVLVMNADGTGATKVVDSTGNEHYPPAWSPDGQSLMYTADGPELEGEIMSVDLRTGTLTTLTDNSDQDVYPDWRP